MINVKSKMPNKILVTSPMLPEIQSFCDSLKEIYASKWITNMGAKHTALEQALKIELGVKHCQIFNNGTIALLTAIKALDLPYGSEIITTPFTFAATPHCLVWNGCKPIFCDIQPNTMTIDTKKN